MTPESLAKAGTERAEQVALFAWAALTASQYPELRLLFAIPNGGLRNKIVAANLKAEGVRAGVPDMFLPVARGRWHGLFIELKRRTKNHVSSEQLKMIVQLQAQGYGAAVCIGWEVARDCILAYLNLKI